ncbi:MAG: ATP12 chaperone family protein [Rhodospirillales bacterium]|nr:ATP12 chaperone family protein [Rhodospirillales bacterium]MCB9996860.1 ATP12 chaperone family protein [Rhodospirillales bacterium]
MKKFYKMVSVASCEDGYVVELDGKPVQTPARVPLAAPNQAMAEALAEEWMTQGDDIVPDTMPLTQILTTAQDHIPRDRGSMTAKILPYLDTDLLCYRTDMPEDLAIRQAESWDIWLNWFAQEYGTTLQTTTGLQALRQDLAAHEKVAQTVAQLDDAHFCILQLVTTLSGSLVLALAFLAGKAAPEQVFEAANIEELYKAEIYNEAEHGAAPLQESKQNAMSRDLFAARKFLDLLKI